MIKAIMLALVVGLATTTAAVAGSSSVPTKKAGTLTVGFDVPAPGFWNGHVSGTSIKNPNGFEAGLSRAIAKKLGLTKIVYKRAPFGTSSVNVASTGLPSSPTEAASNIPFDSRPRNLRGARLATTIIFRPMISSGA